MFSDAWTFRSILSLYFKLPLASKWLENSLLRKKKIKGTTFLIDSQKHSENHQLSQGNKAMRASKGQIAVGYCLERITGDFSMTVTFPLHQKQAPHLSDSKLILRTQLSLYSLINTDYQAGGNWGRKFSVDSICGTAGDPSHIEKKADFLSRWQDLLIVITDTSPNTWSRFTYTLRHHFTGWWFEVKSCSYLAVVKNPNSSSLSCLWSLQTGLLGHRARHLWNQNFQKEWNKPQN